MSPHPVPQLIVVGVVNEGLGHNYSPKMAYFMGLATIFADWNLPPDKLNQDLAAIDGYYASLSARFRFRVPVPEDVYGKLGWKLFEEGRHDDSGEVFRTWAERHPQSSVALVSLGSFYRETGSPDDAVAMFEMAIALEEKSERPRTGFILDLKRDIDALLPEEES